jgi:TonB-linked SusC/RagA family outer membrane protein
MQFFTRVLYEKRKRKPLLQQVIMRLQFVTLLIILACLQVAAKSDAQRITLSVNDQPLEKTFNQIEQQSGYNFWYQKSQLKNAGLVSLKLKDATLKEALEQLFKDQPFSYQVIDKTIVVKERNSNLLGSVQNLPQNITVSGTVTNEQGEPLSGVNISIKGTKTGTSTDSKGSYRLQAEAGKVLVFSFVGYQNEEVPLSSPEKIDITLKPSQSELDKIQVIAYGKTTKRLSVGNTSGITAEEISNQPVSNPILALQGRVPGITIEQSSGLPGANVTVRIQGLNSISQGREPFYVIDGVPYAAQNLASISDVLNGGSPLAFINPATIESIEVLKDADATSIYGSRAANGAILITTKKGKEGRTQVDFNAQEGWGKISKKFKLLNTQQYLEIRKEAYFTNDKLTTTSTQYPTQYDINGTWDQNHSTDWQQELLGGTSRYQDYQAALSGGNSGTQFLFGASYHKETVVFPGDLSDRKVAIQFSLNHRSANNKFRFQLSGNYLDDVNNLAYTDLTNTALTLAPNAPALYLPDGGLNWELLPNGNSSWTNPLAYLQRSYDAKTNNFLANSVVSYQVLPGLDLRSSIGYNKLRGDENAKLPFAYFAPEVRPAATNSVSVQNSTKTGANWIIEPQLNYKRSAGYGALDLLLGVTFQNIQNNLLAIKASGFASDGQLDNIRSATAVSITDASKTEYRYTALFGRIGYNYKQRYLLNLTGRRDGTSRFGSENRFHSFYSVGGAWIFSEESFAQKLHSFLSFGKLRASYGTTGSDQIADYSYLNLYSNVSAPVAYQGAAGLSPDGHTNPYLQWEQTSKLNIGLDLVFWGERILLNANFFRNICGNQLVKTSLPITTGFNSIQQNLPAKVLNQGIELSLEVKPVVLKSIKWISSINLTIPKNKLLAFPDLSSNNSYKNTLIIGEPIQIARTYNYAGINSVTGLYQFVASDGTLTSSPSSTTDRTQLVSTLPKWFGGIQNSITFHNFQLDFLFQFVNQNATDYKGGNLPGTFKNQPVTVLDRWRDKDHLGSVQLVSTKSTPSFSAYTSSNGIIADASFCRLKNASFSWLMPNQWAAKLKVQQVRAFVLGQNLLTITKFQGDPETHNISSLPPLRVITAGLHVSL